MGFNEWVLALCTVAGPILAVQAQKWVEVVREKRNAKLRVFTQLMATRAARLTPQHVQALNMISIVFYGTRFLGWPRRSRTEQEVLDTWHEYLDFLAIDPTGMSEADLAAKYAGRDEVFISLLHRMAVDLRYTFDRVEIKRGGYHPVGHQNIEMEQGLVRQGVLSVLSGEKALRMDIGNVPVNQEAIEIQRKWQADMLAALRAMSSPR